MFYLEFFILFFIFCIYSEWFILLSRFFSINSDVTVHKTDLNSFTNRTDPVLTDSLIHSQFLIFFFMEETSHTDLEQHKGEWKMTEMPFWK